MLGPADDDADVAVVERNFADFYDLPASGQVGISGDRSLDVVGLGMAPEYFFVTTEDGSFFAEANFAALFVPLATAQRLSGRPGMVNDLVVSLRDGVDPAAVAGDFEQAFADAGLGLGVTVMTADDEDAYRMLYDDIEGDRKFWNVFAGLILAGATFGAFNLSSRMVEAQRREIGIGMALGASRRQLAMRPLFVGAEIAVLGVVLGVGVGLATILALRPVYTNTLPLPVWHTDFQPGVFLRGAALGFVLPFLATAWPVWRAVRVAPVDAIATANRTARSGLAPLLRRLRWPASAFRRMPLGNVLRSPRRTMLTALGIAAAIATLVALLGLLDSYRSTLDRNDRQVVADHADRMAVGLDGFVPADGAVISALEAAPSVGAVDPVLRVGGRLARPEIAPSEQSSFDVLIEAVDFDSAIWRPTLAAGGLVDRSGVLISRAAADDLGVGLGDLVTLQHPVRDGAGFTLATTPVVVTGIHISPFRFNVYLDRSALAAFGATGLANQLSVLPAAGATTDDVERELFGLDGVTSVQPVAASSQIVRDSLGDFTAVFQVLEGFILVLALLIAYNATSINADERARERATLFAFGFPMRRVLTLEVVEGLLYGLLGTALGVGIGAAIVRWMARNLLTTTMPDLRLIVTVSPATVATAIVLGVVAVAVAPLLTARKIRRMDVPGTLRVVE
jgi:putative ABC transport system permease protein